MVKTSICKNLINYVAVSLIVFSISTAMGQTQTDSTSVYKNEEGFGGPKTVGAQLQIDNAPKFNYRIPITHTKSWYDFKTRFSEKTGIEFGINYTSLFIWSSETISEENTRNANSGVFDLQAGWTFLNRKKGKNTGKIFFKINDRHSYRGPGSTSPMFHGINESGYYGLPATGYRDYSIRMLELNYQQALFDNRFHFVLGKIDVTNYFNFHGLIVPWQHFIGYTASVSGSVNWPDQGLGGVVSFRPTQNLYIMGGLTDVRGDVFREGEFLNFGDQFQEWKFWKGLEIGYVPSFGERYFKKISITYWNSDAYTNVNGDSIDSGEGVAVSAHWFFQERFIPFVRFGISDGNGENVFYKADIQLGHGYRFLNYDILGVSLSWNDPNVPDANDQITAELFYRMNLTAHFEVTPSIQYISNPTFNPDDNNLFYLGFRGRITL